MSVVEVSHIVKSFGGAAAVNDISFSVEGGEVFGLIGPNGAGKSTTIRMIMDIIKPDSGTVTMQGQKWSEESKNAVGYLPEERGLYKKLSAMESIIYLSSLKGMDARAAEKKAEELLDKIGMLSQKDKKIEEMSKGMGQMIQFIVTILHDPQLVILDEPFAGLDPANVELLREMIGDLRRGGKAIMLSTHRMNEVEELCDRVLMINEGKAVLYGTLEDIKSRYAGNSVYLSFEGKMGQLPGVIECVQHKGFVELVLGADTSPAQVLKQLVKNGASISRFEAARPSLNEIFLRIAGEKHE